MKLNYMISCDWNTFGLGMSVGRKPFWLAFMFGPYAIFFSRKAQR